MPLGLWEVAGGRGKRRPYGWIFAREIMARLCRAMEPLRIDRFELNE